MKKWKANEVYINMLWSFYAQKHSWVLLESFFFAAWWIIMFMIYCSHLPFLNPKRNLIESILINHQRNSKIWSPFVQHKKVLNSIRKLIIFLIFPWKLFIFMAFWIHRMNWIEKFEDEIFRSRETFIVGKPNQIIEEKSIKLWFSNGVKNYGFKTCWALWEFDSHQKLIMKTLPRKAQ